jgi:hypothetical protein
MARPRKNPLPAVSLPSMGGLSSWAETLGEALGRGVARGINAGLSAGGIGSAFSGGVSAGLGGNTMPRRRGRPPKLQTGGPVPPEKRCKVEGCPNAARSKGLCSKHYQAERRRVLGKA